MAGKPCNGTIRGKDVGGYVASNATHDRIASSHTKLVDIVRTVGLTKDTMDVVGEALEPKPDVQVGHDVIVCYSIVVDAGVLLRDGDGDGHDIKYPLELHPHAIGISGPRNGQSRNNERLPPCAESGGDIDGLIIQGQFEAINVFVPLDGPFGTHKEAVVGETDPKSLDPSKVTARVVVASANEVGIDMDTDVGEDAKVLVLLPVEVEVVAVTAGEAWVATGDARVEVAHAQCLAAGAEEEALVGAAAVAFHVDALPLAAVVRLRIQPSLWC